MSKTDFEKRQEPAIGVKPDGEPDLVDKADVPRLRALARKAWETGDPADFAAAGIPLKIRPND